MFCPNCGNPVPEIGHYCPTCGFDLQSAEGQINAQQGNSFHGNVTYAGFWKRFVAWIIDMVVTQVVISTVSLIAGGIGGGLLGLFGGWLYFALMESSSKQATLGKMALGIIVTDYNGNRVSFARATGRYFAKIISAIILLIGYVMIAFTERKQGLHDIISDCLVVTGKGQS